MKTAKIIVMLGLTLHLLLTVPVILADPTLTTFLEIFSQRETWAFQITSDLLFGFLLFAVLVYGIDGSLKTAALWFVAANLLGNPAFAIYLLLNIGKLGADQRKPLSN